MRPVLKTAACLLAVLSLAWPDRAALSAAEPPDTAPPIAGLSFLVGEWNASGGGQPGKSTGTFSFQWAADRHALIRYNQANTDSSRHFDVMLIYADDDSLAAIYTDNEGHLIRYRVSVSANPQRVVFESAGPGPRFRLWYEVKPENTLASGFEIAAPGAAEFKTYLEGTAHRKI